ncbi:uncharacterized protein BDR25DRAFT_324125 [Lindgomyces ingoldianus]|uniref:Uncharacterized protein n=1 Tax=Lindgomyces ingoldianus TaxID=673940 RepID=A0ACB6R1X8_9PLEO|nr:uncharacterized protein BDR25DRAFT_324125 [Lindgomyces ingoldianus]KAF2472795.1 hypothetical protein BDR25DRAFT_324125 [Lindgomyces ingoldianus]
MNKRISRRKAHTKSRKGCFQCKQRHSKCNEVHPRCANCVRLDIDCIWPAATKGSPLYLGTPHPESPNSVLPSTRLGGSPTITPIPVEPELPLEDLKLMHHWTTKMYKPLHPTQPAKEGMWQVRFTELGFDHPFLLRGFLALATIHKAVSEPHSDVQSLLHQADSHMSRCLATYRKNLEQPSPETAVPMFLLSTILVIYNMGSGHLEEPESPIDSIYHCFRLLQGVKVVIQPQWETIKESDVFASVAKTIMGFWQSDLDLEDEGFGEILRLKELTDGMESSDRETCLHAIVELHKTFIKVWRCSEDQDEHATMFTWPAVLQDHFMNLLSVYNPAALIILSHFAVLLARSRSSWWVQDWPDRILRASKHLLESKPEFQRWLAWPSEHIAVGN